MPDISPYKVIKMDSGEDIICKVLREFEDALVIERPFSLAEQQHFHKEKGEIINHTGFQRWMNFTNETEFVVYKNKILATAILAPELQYYYKHLCTKLIVEERNQIKTEEEAAQKMKQLQDTTMAMVENRTEGGDDEDFAATLEQLNDDNGSNILMFNPKKDKLH